MKTLFLKMILLTAVISLFGILISNAHASQILSPSLPQDPAELLVGQGAAEGHPLLYLYGVAQRVPATVADDATTHHPWWSKCESYSMQLQVYSPFKDQVVEGSWCQPFHPIGEEKTDDLCRFRCSIIAPEISEQPANRQRPMPMRPEQGPASAHRPYPARPAQGYETPAEAYDANSLVIRSFYPMPDGIARVSVGFHLEDLLQKLSPDSDQDGVPDALDNCPNISNVTQVIPEADKDGKPVNCAKPIFGPWQVRPIKDIGVGIVEKSGDAGGADSGDQDGEISGANTSGASEQALLKQEEAVGIEGAEGAEGAGPGCSLIPRPQP